jgi:hypothetical protein
VELYLEAGVDYQIQGFAMNTGWCNPFVDGQGTLWSFGEIIEATRATASGMTLVVADPCA